MFLSLFDNLKDAKVPVSLREYLTLLEAMQLGLSTYDVEQFYYLARTCLIKDERNLDKFDLAFSKTFKGLEGIAFEDVMAAAEVPEEWLRKLAEKHLSPEEMKDVEALGGFDKLMETLKERLKGFCRKDFFCRIIFLDVCNLMLNIPTLHPKYGLKSEDARQN